MTAETRRPIRTLAELNWPASVGAQTPRPAIAGAIASVPAPGGGSNSTADQWPLETQVLDVGRGSNSQQAIGSSASNATAPAGARTRQPNLAAPSISSPADGTDAVPDRTATAVSVSNTLTLFDPALALAADILDDTEKVWIANANRLRILTRSEADSDGEYRGFGLDESHPDVARLAAMVATLEKLTQDATKHLEKVMRRHPLHPWVKAQKGLGDKQVARLLAAIGDPYWNTLHDRPRTVSELWAYCGFHVVSAGQALCATRTTTAGRGQAGGGDTGQAFGANQCVFAGVAPRRQRGQKSNWSETARKRAWLIANSVVKAGGPYRGIYDAIKEKYSDAVHDTPCVRCGPAGKPAQAGSPLSKAHIHARGLRAISKAVLKDLWIEARALHGVTEERAA